MTPPGKAGSRRDGRGKAMRFFVGVTLVAILYAAKPVIVPLVLAGLIAFILSLPVSYVQRTGIGRIPSVFLVVIGALLVTATITYAVGNELSSLIAELPKHREELQAKIHSLRGAGRGSLARLVDMIGDLGRSLAPEPHGDVMRVTVAPATGVFERIGELLQGLAGTLVTAVLVLVLVVFMLVRREDLRNRAFALLGHGRLTGSTRAAVEGAQRVSQLLLGQLTANVAFGTVWAIVLWALGVPYAFVWGVMAALLRFVPYLGTITAAAAPILVSIAISPGWVRPLVAAGAFLVIDLISGNVIEPLFLGRRAGVSPIALLVAATFWTWLWGPVGLVVSTPLTVCLVVLGQHAPPLGFLAVLLGDAPALDPHAVFYQRLLAADEAEAYDVAEAYAREHGLAATFDDVILRAIRLARHDRRRESLDARGEAQVLAGARRILARLTPTVEPSADGPRVLGCPAHHPAEEVALDMIGTLCAKDGVRFEAVSSRVLATEIVERLEEERPDALVIAIVPPGGIVQAVFLCERARAGYPDARIVVAFFGSTQSYDQLLVRMRKAGATHLTTSIRQSYTQIKALLGSRDT